MKINSKFALIAFLAIGVGLFSLNSCNNSETETIDDTEAGIEDIGEELKTPLCIAEPSWFPHYKTPAPKSTLLTVPPCGTLFVA